MTELAPDLAGSELSPIAPREAAASNSAMDNYLFEAPAVRENWKTYRVSVGGHVFMIEANMSELPSDVTALLSRIDQLVWKEEDERALKAREDLVEDLLKVALEGRLRCCLPEIFVTPRGTFELSWRSGDRELELEIIDPGQYEAYFVNDATGFEWDPGVAVSLAQITPYLNELGLES